jgi:hypothetical protein
VAKTTPATPPPQQPSVPNRRKFFRRSKPFQGVYYAQPGERVPTIGLDVSGGGMCILLQQPVKDPAAEMMIGAVIENKPFTIVGTIRWSDVVKVKGVDHYRYGLKLQSIADEDWDRLIQWTLESNAELVEGQSLSAAQRDALVTASTQNQISQELLNRERIDPFGENRLPLIEYNFVKYTMRQGVPYVWLKVRSRTIDKTLRTAVDHMTNILVGCEDGNLKIVD